MNLTLDELFETCPICNGTGKKKEEPEPNGGRSYRPNPLSLSGDNLTDCDACDGYGRGKLTQTGQTLLDFIRVVKRRGMI